jgi:hypothetical protein
VRLQLSPRLQAGCARCVCVALVAAVAYLPRPAAGNTEASSRITIFKEPSSANKGITVIHPQTDFRVAAGSSVDFTAGYEVDIVSGATPALFGPRTGVDAVTGATEFSDTRHQVKAGVAYNRPNSGISAAGSYGWESDYRSLAVSASTRSDILDHNFVLSLAYTHNFDDVCDANNTAVAGQPLDLKPLTSSQNCFNSDAPEVVTHRLHIDTLEPGLTWTATPRLVLQAGTTVQILDGFQSNPYRSVLVGSQQRTPQESLPRFRQRFAVWGGAAYFFPNLRASVMGTGRLYRDTWAVQAVTGELNVNKYLTQQIVVGLRGRYHIQQGAIFYRDGLGYRTLGPAGRYWTGDRELSPMSNLLAGGKLSYVKRPEQDKTAWYGEIEVAVKGELLLYHLDSPDAPNYDRKQAYIIQSFVSIQF